MWLLPILTVAIAVALAIPLGRYLAWVLDDKFTPPAPLHWFENRIDTGPQSWKAYAGAMLGFNVVAFVIGYAVLALQPYHPAVLNPDGKGMLAATTIFNTACSFLTNTNLQHYAGEVHLSYGSQLFAVMYKQFVTPAIGLAAVLAVIRGLRGDPHLGNFYRDLWRGTAYVMLPLSLILGVLLLAGGVPMTFAGNADGPIARGPVAAVVAIKQLGTNGGGFFGTNSAHPFENPTAWTNLLESVAIVLLPMAVLVMFGRMIGDARQARVVFAISLLVLGGLIAWGVVHDAARPNPGLAGLPVDQRDTGNLEGKELRFGRAAGPTWAALTTATSNGSVNCMHDSLNPAAGLTPLTGMWLNCVFGGVGVGFINLFVYLIVAVFLAGLMVGRTPEYLGKKVEAREMKLAAVALLAHPLLILVPVGLFAATGWAAGSANNPGPHGFTETVYEFSSAAANNGSGFEGLGDTVGFHDAAANPTAPATHGPHWDVATAIVMMLGRFIPIIAPLAVAGSLAAKKRVPFTAGTLRTDTATFGVVLLGTILLVGAMTFLPVAALGPVATHYGPLPFGR